MASTGFSVRLADWDSDQAALRRVRTTVFVEEQAVPELEEWDGLDGDCVHAIAEAPGEGAIATGRLQLSGKIGRMAVLAGWRGRGVGAAILRCLLEDATRRGLREIHLHAQVQVVEFYGRLGFVAEGPEFEEAGIAHRLMRLQLPAARSEPRERDAPTGTRSVLSGKADFAAAVVEVASVAARSLAIFTPDLEHGVYDTPDFIGAVKRLVLSRSHARVRVLISDPGRVQRSVNRLLHVGRRLSSFIEFRQLTVDFQSRSDAFLVADVSALVYRANIERWEGVADTREPRMARMYLEQFEQMWQLSESAVVLRQLSP